MGEVWSLKGEYLSAAESYQRALREADDPEKTVRLQCLIGEAYVTLGDARALSSSDSRTIGPVPLSRTEWRVVWRYWPPTAAGRI